ncbi:MAG: DUF4279 domain-containing protein [Acidobacteriota bacterium]
MSTEINEVKVKLYITSPEYCHSAVTKALEIEPTRSWEKGEQVATYVKRKAESHGWLFQIQEDGVEDTETLLCKMLDTIAPAEENLIELQSRYDMSVEVVIFANQYMPHVGLSPTTMTRLGQLGLPISFDIYALYD